VAADNFSAHEARYSAITDGRAGMLPPLAKKCRKSEAYARFVAADWLAAMSCSVAPEKPRKTASGGGSGVLLDVTVLRTDKAAPALACGVRIFFMVSPMDGLEKQ
jgi:hypothetical protein